MANIGESESWAEADPAPGVPKLPRLFLAADVLPLSWESAGGRGANGSRQPEVSRVPLALTWSDRRSLFAAGVPGLGVLRWQAGVPGAPAAGGLR